jgi:hypothetical protein
MNECKGCPLGRVFPLVGQRAKDAGYSLHVGLKTKLTKGLISRF